MLTYEGLLQENPELRCRVAEQERQIASLKRQTVELKKLGRHRGARLPGQVGARGRAPGRSGRRRDLRASGRRASAPHGERLSQKSFLELMKLVVGQLPLIRRMSERRDE